MLRSVKELCGSTVDGLDADFRKLSDLLCGPRSWRVRYWEVEAGQGIKKRRAWVPPRPMGANVTKASVKKRLKLTSPIIKARGLLRKPVHATDGDIGHIDDLIVDDEHWIIRYLVITTGPGLLGRKVLVAAPLFSGARADAETVRVALTRDKIRHSPPYDHSAPVNRDYEGHLCDYYGRPKYWEQAPKLSPVAYPCRQCRRRFRSRIELLAHRRLRHTSRTRKRRRQSRPAKDLVTKIEEMRPRRGSGWRQTTRSS